MNRYLHDPIRNSYKNRWHRRLGRWLSEFFTTIALVLVAFFGSVFTICATIIGFLAVILTPVLPFIVLLAAIKYLFF